MAGSALAQVVPGVNDLGGGNRLFREQIPLATVSEITNGTAEFNALPPATILTYGGALTDRLGQLSVIKSGASVSSLVLTGSGLNTYSGSTIVASGTLRAGAVSVFSPNSLLNVGPTGIVDLGGFNQSTTGLVATSTGAVVTNSAPGLATLTITNAAATESAYAGTTTGNLRIVKAGAGLQGFSETSTRTGGTELQAGTLRFGRSGALGTGALDVTGNSTLRASRDNLTLANDINLTGAQLTLDTFRTTLSGKISGTGSLRKAGSTIDLNLTNGANDFSGGFLLENGQINVVSGSLGTGNLVTTATQVSMGIATPGTAVVLNNNIVLGGILNFEKEQVGDSIRLNGQISGSGRLFLKEGDGTLIVAGNNIFTGGTQMSSGVFGFASNTAAGPGAITIGGTGALAAHADNLTIANEISGDHVTAVDTRGNTMTLSGLLRNRSATELFGINKTGLGTLNLNGATTYTGATNVTAGTLNVNSVLNSNVTVASGGTLGGTGTIGPANSAIILSGGTVSPGGDGFGTLRAGTLDLQTGSIFNLNLTTPGILGGATNDAILTTQYNVGNGALLNVNFAGAPTEGLFPFLSATAVASIIGGGFTLNAAPTDFTYSVQYGLTTALLVTFNGPRFWDGTGPFGNNTVNGGDGVWATGTTNWTGASGAAIVAWGNTDGVFAGNAGNVTVDGTQTFTNLEFRTAGYNLSGGTLTSTGGTLFINNAGTTTINSVIAGSGGLTKTGAGTLVLGGANSFTGGYTSGADTGVTVAGTNTALGVGTANFGANTTLRTAGLGSVILANNIDYTGPFIIDVPVVSLVLDGVISGTGALSFTGPGNGTISPFVRLDTANSFTGAVTATNVHLSADADARLGNLANTLTFDNSTFSSNPAFTSSRGITLIGENRFLQNGTMTLNGVIGGDGRLNQAGPQTLVLTNVGNSFSGGVEISSGTLSVASNSALGAIAGGISFTNDTNFIVTPPVLQFTANVISARAIDIQATVTGTIDTVANEVTLSGPITGAGGLAKTGTGTLVLSGTNSFTGTYASGAGTGVTVVDSDTALGATGASFGAGTTLRTQGNQTLTVPIAIDGGVTIDQNGALLTLDGVISGNSALSFVGAAPQLGQGIVLNGVNTYTGLTTITNAGVVVRADSGLGNAANDLVLNGGVLLSTATFAMARDVELQGAFGGLFVNPGQTLTSNGVISGGATSALSMGGGGTLVLGPGANTYQGLTILGGGTLQISNGASLGTGVAVVFASNSTLRLSAPVTVSKAVSIQSGVTATIDTAGFDSTLNGVIVENGAGGILTKVGLGQLTLNQAGFHSGGTNLTQGAIQIRNGGSLGTGAFTMADGTTLRSGAANLNVNNSVAITGTGTVDTNGNSFRLNGLISGGTLAKTGLGTLTLANAASTYSGGTTLTAGTIAVTQSSTGAPGALTSGPLGTGTLAMATGTTLQSAAAGLTIGNAVAITGTGTVDTNGNSFTLAGLVSGGALTKANAGTLILNGANTYTGGTALNAGTIQVGNNTALGTGALAMADGTTLQSGAGTFTLTNAVGITGTGTVDTAGQTLTLGGIVSGGALTKVGAGTLVLTGANTYAGGTNLNVGTIQVGNNAALGTATLAMADGTTLQSGAGTFTLTNAVGITGTGTVDTAGQTLTLGGAVSGGTVNKIGAGTLVLTGTNSHASTTINDGVVSVASDANLGAANGGVTFAGTGNGVLRFTNGATAVDTGTRPVTLTASGTIETQGSAAVTMGGAITGAGNLTKTGTGQLILTGTSTYTGATAVNTGTLTVNGSLGNTAVTVASGATLSGTGSIAGAVNILDGGILSPGTSAGTLTVGPLTLSNASLLNWDFGAANTIGGPLNDLVIVNGNLTLDGLLNVTQSAGGTFGTGIYEIFQYSGALTDNTLSINGLLPNGQTGFVQTLVPGQVNLVVTQAPSITLFWDGADGIGNGVISGGDGVWNALNTNWTGAPPSALNTNWQSTVGIFQGAAGTVSIQGAQAFETLQFAVDGYTLNSSEGGQLTTATSSILFGSTGTNTTINALINGAGEIVKQGGGKITLFGDNGYAGGTKLQFGTIGVGNNNALGTGTLAMSSGTTLQSAAPDIVISNLITTAGDGIIDQGAAGNMFTLASNISGPGSISAVGGGVLVLSVDNDFTNLGINAGTVRVGSNRAAGIGGIALNNNATLQSGGAAITLANNVETTGNGLVRVRPGEVLTLNGSVGGAGSISQVGPGTLVLNGNNSFVNLGINAGTVRVGSNTAAGIGGIALNSNATLQSGGLAITLANNVETTGNGLVRVRDAEVLTLNGSVGGAGSISQVGPGVLVLNGNNSFVNLGINAGTVRVGSNTAAGVGGIALNSNATLQSGGAAITLANNVETTGNGLVRVRPGEVLTLNGSVGGAGSISQVGPGTLVLNGNNSFVNLGINAGTVQVGSNTAAGIGGIALNSNATLQSGGAAITLANNVETTGNGLVNVRAGEVLTLNGSVGGAGSISQVGPGTLVLNGNNSFVNLGINAGTVRVGSNTAAGIGGIALNSNATLQSGGAAITLANNVETTGNGLVNVRAGEVLTLNGSVAGAGSISTVGTGNLVLNGNNSFTNLGIGAGTVTVGTNTAAGVGGIAIASNSTLAAGVSGLVLTNRVTTLGNGIINQGTGTFTLAGLVEGAGSISTINTGNLVLNGNNSFTNLGIGTGGTVTVGTNTAAGVGGIAIANNSTLAAGVSGLVLTNRITTVANGIINQGTGTFTLAGLVEGAGSISTINTGNLVLNGNNSFTNLGIGTGGTVTVGTNTAGGVGGIAIANNSTLAAGVSGLVLTNRITTAANGIINQGAGTFTLNGLVEGPGSISTVGSGNLVLNSNNTFTNLGIGAGTVTVGTNTAAGVGGIALASNSTLAAGVSGLVLTNRITTLGNGIINQGTGTFTLNGLIEGAGSISTIGSGNLVLNSNNTFTNLGIGAGTVTVGSNTAAGVGGIAIANNSTLAAGVSGLVLTNRITTLGNGIINQGTGTFTLAGLVEGAGSISTINTGNLILNGNNSFTNLGIGTGGTVTVGTNTAAGVGGIAIANNSTLAAGVSGLVLTNRITTAANGIINQGTGTFTLAGLVEGAGSISTVNTGNLVLNSNNSFTNLGIGAGTVTVGANRAAGVGGIALASNSTLAAGVSGLTLTNRITTLGNGLINQGAGTFTLAGLIEGAGSISTIGSGNLVLNSNNTFTNLGIGAGTVTVGTNTAAGVGGIAIASNSTLAAGVSGLTLTNRITTLGNGIINQGTGTFTLAGLVEGPGSISTVNTGNLVLNSNNVFTNLGIGTGGTVTVGTNTAAGVGGIAIANNSTLAAGVSGLVLTNRITTAANGIINQGTGTFTLNGLVEGPGSISTINTGNLILNSNNVFTNLGIGTGGTVTVGTNTAAGVGGIALADNSTLAAGRSDLVISNRITATGAGRINQGTGNMTLAGLIEGSGGLTVVGTGVLTVSATNALTGPTTVAAGRLNVTGSLARSAVTVQSGATLSGTGAVGALTALSGSTITPGATTGSVATIAVNGALTLAAGSTYLVDVTTTGADRLSATGPASIAGNLLITPGAGPFTTFNQSYTIVSSSARTGTFATTTLGTYGAAFAPTLVYDATSVILRLAPGSLVAAGGSQISGNALAVANSFDTAVRGGYNPQPFFALYTQGANLPVALSQLSGELRSAERRVLLEDTRVVREAAFDRLNAGLAAVAGSQSVTSETGDGKALTFWLRGAGSWGTADGDDVGSRFTTEQRGFLTGIDYQINDFKVGGMFHYTNTDVEFATLGKSQVESIGGAIYAGYRHPDAGLAVGLGGSIASNSTDGARAITAPGLQQSLTGKVDGTTYQIFAEAAFDLVKAANTRVEPFGRVAYAKVNSDAFAETGGIAAVNGTKQGSDLTLTTLGLRGAIVTGMATLSGSAGWARTSGDRSAATLLSITGPNTPFVVNAAALDKDAVALEAQASFNLSQTITLGVGYSGLIGSNNSDHGARATLTVGF